MEEDAASGGREAGRLNGAAAGRPAALPNGGARPKQPAARGPPPPPPAADDSDEEPPSPASPRRANGRPEPRLLSHSASESDCTLDECVYTYKGDRPADHNRNHSRPPPPPAPADGGRVSPDLDFLEMDFDPSAFDTSDEDERGEPPDWPAAAAAAAALVTVSPAPSPAAAPAPAAAAAPDGGEAVLAEAGAPGRPDRAPSASPASSRASSRSLDSSPSASPASSRGDSPPPLPVGAAFNRLSFAAAAADAGDDDDDGDNGDDDDDDDSDEVDSDENGDSSDGGDRSPENNIAGGRRPGARRLPERKVTNRRLARYNLGSCSAPAASPSDPAAPPPAPALPHSRSDHSAVSGGSGKYRHCCSNDLSDRQPGGCRDRLRRRENSVFNIPGVGDPNLQHDGCHAAAEKAFLARKGSADAGLFELGLEPPEKVMIWTEMEAFTRQVTQIGRSACGATAVINVLLALGYQPDQVAAAAAVSTRLRRDAAPLAEYLFSRAEAGTTHKQLIDSVDTLTDGQVCGRFFSMHPRRSFQLVRWLAGWLRRGAVPVATLNLQRGVPPQQTVPDAWHHQMAFGVGPQGVYLTNPLECVSASLLGEQLSSDSVLLVRREDVTSRWRDGCRLHPLMSAADPRWRRMNVLGQVVNVLREEADRPPPGVRRALTQHVTIPAWYRSGVTLFLRRSSPHCADLLAEPELPRLEDC